jgi:hypothetical protein
MKEDKIFNNRYNTGEVEYEVFGQIKVHSSFLPKDVFDEYDDNEIQNDLYEVFVNADFYKEYVKNKKVLRGDVTKIYYYFDTNLKNSKNLSPVTKFIAIADFMSIPYELLYEEMPPTYKEEILKELDQKYNIFAKRNIHRLF